MLVRLKLSWLHLKEEEKESQRVKANQVDLWPAGSVEEGTNARSARSSQRSFASKEKANLVEEKVPKLGDNSRGDNFILVRGLGMVTVQVEVIRDQHINHINHQHHLGTILARPI